MADEEEVQVMSERAMHAEKQAAHLKRELEALRKECRAIDPSGEALRRAALSTSVEESIPVKGPALLSNEVSQAVDAAVRGLVEQQAQQTRLLESLIRSGSNGSAAPQFASSLDADISSLGLVEALGAAKRPTASNSKAHAPVEAAPKTATAKPTPARAAKAKEMVWLMAGDLIWLRQEGPSHDLCR